MAFMTQNERELNMAAVHALKNYPTRPTAKYSVADINGYIKLFRAEWNLLYASDEVVAQAMIEARAHGKEPPVRNPQPFMTTPQNACQQILEKPENLEALEKIVTECLRSPEVLRMLKCKENAWLFPGIFQHAVNHTIAKKMGLWWDKLFAAEASIN